MTLQTIPQNSGALLRRAFRANSLFCGSGGLAFMTASRPIALFLGLDTPLALSGIGAMLLLYAAALWFSASRPHLDPRFAWTAVIGDAAWVLGSYLILLTDWLPLTPAGWWAVAIVADMVTVFAVVQFYGLRQISKR